MTKIAIFAGGRLSDFSTDFELFAGVDRGSPFLLKNQLPLDLAVGDFDSVSKEELQMTQEEAGDFIRTAPEKDDTDTELALKAIFSKYPQAQVTIFGVFGDRIDHMMSNLFLPSDPELTPFTHQTTSCDEQNTVQFYPVGSNQILPKKEVIYASFMADGDADLTIKSAKYELDVSNLFKKKIYSSNEFPDQPTTVASKSDYLIVIQSKDR